MWLLIFVYTFLKPGIGNVYAIQCACITRARCQSVTFFFSQHQKRIISMCITITISCRWNISRCEPATQPRDISKRSYRYLRFFFSPSAIQVESPQTPISNTYVELAQKNKKHRNVSYRYLVQAPQVYGTIIFYVFDHDPEFNARDHPHQRNSSNRKYNNDIRILFSDSVYIILSIGKETLVEFFRPLLRRCSVICIWIRRMEVSSAVYIMYNNALNSVYRYE